MRIQGCICVHACGGVAEESGGSATVQVPLKHRATRENQNRDSWSHTRSRKSAVEELARTNADRERKQMRTIGRGDRQGRNKCVKQHFINDHGSDEKKTAGPVADIRSMLISDLQTIDICQRSRLCESPRYLRFLTRELCADAFFLFFCLAGSVHSPNYNQPPLIFLEPTVLRSLSVRMVLTVKSAKFRFFPADFLSLFVPLFGAAGDHRLSNVCGQQQKPLWCFSCKQIL